MRADPRQGARPLKPIILTAWRNGHELGARKLDDDDAFQGAALWLDILAAADSPYPDYLEATRGEARLWRLSPREIIAAAAGSGCGCLLAATLAGLDAWREGET
jgi:hypothetical protein